MFELFVTGIADALAQTFARQKAADGPGPILVLGAPKVARALRDRGLPSVTVGPWSRALRRASGAAVCAGGHLPFADGAAAGAVCVGADADLLEASRVVRGQGTLAIVTREDPTLATTAALNAGLLDIEQQSAGRAVLVTGRVLGPL